MSSAEVAALRARAAGLRDAARAARGLDSGVLVSSLGRVWSSPRVERLVADLRGALAAIAAEADRVEVLAAGLERRADVLERSSM
jgi:lambda repressor-like predicted transcriptional regulator